MGGDQRIFYWTEKNLITYAIKLRNDMWMILMMMMTVIMIMIVSDCADKNIGSVIIIWDCSEVDDHTFYTT